jgi:hypothetical protein
MSKKSALILTILASASLIILTANLYAGQMGWTLQQCQERFGPEFTPAAGTDSYRFSDHMPYWHSSQAPRVVGHTAYGDPLYAADGESGGDTHYFHAGACDVYFNFYPDGTVGAIQWVRLDGKPFSETELHQRLKEAAAVHWQRVPNGRRTPEYDWQTAEKRNWVGWFKGNPIFRASEADNGRGVYYLTIWTN